MSFKGEQEAQRLFNTGIIISTDAQLSKQDIQSPFRNALSTEEVTGCMWKVPVSSDWRTPWFPDGGFLPCPWMVQERLCRHPRVRLGHPTDADPSTSLSPLSCMQRVKHIWLHKYSWYCYSYPQNSVCHLQNIYWLNGLRIMADYMLYFTIKKQK